MQLHTPTPLWTPPRGLLAAPTRWRGRKFPSPAVLGGAAAGGGGGASIAALASGVSLGGTATVTVISGATFTAGVAVFGIVIDLSAGVAPTSASINGAAATQIGTTIADSGTAVQMWYAVVSSGTGNITVTVGAGVVGLCGAAAWSVTGYSSSTPSANNSFNGLSPTQADPQGPMSSITVASGGVAAFFIGGTFHTSTANPTTWAQSTRDASLETFQASGNTLAVAGSHISAAGTYAGITATAGSVSWLYSAMIGATWH